MAQFTREIALKALSTVEDPDLHKDLVSLGMVQDLEVNESEGAVSVRIVLTTPACPLKGKIEADVKAALEGAGARGITIKMDAVVRGAQSSAQPGGSNRIGGVRQIIAVSSGKGGVGKSTVAVNLACALAQSGARVGLMDADVYGPNVPTMMGVTEQPKIEKAADGSEVFIPPVAQGVKVMSMGFLIQADQPLVWRGPMLHSVVNQFCHKVQWGELDYLIVDMPPGTGDVQLSLAQLVPVSGAVLVTTPQEVSMQDVRKAFHMFEKVRIPILGIVENMSWFTPEDAPEKKYFIFGKDGGTLLAKKFRTHLLGQMPIVQSVREGGDTGRPVVVAQPQSAIAQSFKELAARVAQQVSILAVHGQDQGPSVQIGKFN